MSANGKSEVPVDFKNARRNPQRLAGIGHLQESKEPPHSDEAEQGVLGCILLSPGETIDRCEEEFKGESEVFYDLRHRLIYEVMRELWVKSRVVDTVAVLEHLRRKDQLDAVGGIAYLASLPDDVPSAANLLYYVDVVAELYALRRLVGMCCEYVGRAYGFLPDIERFIDEFEHDAVKLSMFRQKAKGEGKLTQYLVEHQERLGETWKGGGHGLLTGFPDLDEQIGGGFDPGDLGILAAGPSEGKTTLALNIMAHQARQKIPTALFSMEMPGERIAARLASEQSAIPLKRVRKGLDQEDTDRYATAMKQVAGWPMWIADESGMNIAQIRSRCRRFKSEHGIKLAVIDFLQLVEPGIKSDNRSHAVGHIAKQAKAMAMELQIPVLVLSQLSRDFKKQNRRPTLHDLRESGDVEAAADKVAFLHKPKVDGDIIQVFVDKNRNEDKGRLELIFNAPIFRFETMRDEAGI